MSQVPHTTQHAATSWTTQWGFPVQVSIHTGLGERVVVLRHGEIQGREPPPLVRVHSACLTSEALGSTRCDCREQLHYFMACVGEEGAGILLYFPDHEGRGIGLEAKLRAYALQDEGHDTADANVLLGHPVDSRDYHLAAALLRELGVDQARLMTNNPDKISVLEEDGVRVTRVPAWVPSSEHAVRYLEAKRARMDHLE
jgi:GTP cyclohydrolase II